MNLHSICLSIFIAMSLTSCKDKPAETAPPAPAINTPPAAEAPSGELISSGQLSGQYISAGPDAPVILIVPGSGPTDLDGNSPLGINSNMYKQLAQGLAAKGISSVRVDKHGMFSSTASGDPNAVTVESYAADYRQWNETIRAQTDQSCVYMLGHSEGALMVSAASVDSPNVCGLILVAGVGRPFGDVLRAQLKANPANFLINKDAFAAIDKLEKGERVDTENMSPLLRPLFNQAVQGFLISIMQTDPAMMAKKAGQKTLIIQGTTDLQVSVEDAQILSAATNGKLVLLEGVNHILKNAPKGQIRNLATYKNPDLPIAAPVIDAIEEFVSK